MYRAREFRLILCVDVPDPLVKYAIDMLECLVRAEKAKGGLNYLLSEPSIIAEIRSPPPRCFDTRMGRGTRQDIIASTL